MCDGGGPVSVADALGMLDRALGYLAGVDAGSLPTAVQAEALRGLERAESRHTAARARILGAFAVQGGHEDDGHRSARSWLRWQARVTSGAAAGAVGWARRLAAHPVIWDAMAGGELSASWARQICEWTDTLPGDRRGDADEILAGAAHAGASLAGLAGLAREMYERACAGSGQGPDDGFDDRYLRLGVTFRGAGRAEGDLTPGCTAALAAVLEALGKKGGPEDTRTAGQRRHDALEEACRRLIASGMLPERAGQPTQAIVHMTLAQLRQEPGAAAAEAAWAEARAAQPGWLSGRAADAAACDATIVPLVTGHVDEAALDKLTETFLGLHGLRPPAAASPETTSPGNPGPPGGTDAPAPAGTARGTGPPGRAGPRPPQPPLAPLVPPARAGSTGNTITPGSADVGSADVGSAVDAGWMVDAGRTDASAASANGAGSAGSADGGAGRRCVCGGCTCTGLPPDPRSPQLSPQALARVRASMLRLAADVMSGPGGLAAWLRHAQHAGTPAGAPSLPLDISLPLDTGDGQPAIPGHLRRAVLARHQHCGFPGCRVPAAACHIHHIVPRAHGGATALHNLGPFCPFHHLVAIHRWGWAVTMHPDGTITAASPDGTRTLHSHGPPATAA